MYAIVVPPLLLLTLLGIGALEADYTFLTRGMLLRVGALTSLAVVGSLDTLRTVGVWTCSRSIAATDAAASALNRRAQSDLAAGKRRHQRQNRWTLAEVADAAHAVLFNCRVRAEATSKCLVDQPARCGRSRAPGGVMIDRFVERITTVASRVAAQATTACAVRAPASSRSWERGTLAGRRDRVDISPATVGAIAPIEPRWRTPPLTARIRVFAAFSIERDAATAEAGSRRPSIAPDPRREQMNADPLRDPSAADGARCDARASTLIVSTRSRRLKRCRAPAASPIASPARSEGRAEALRRFVARTQSIYGLYSWTTCRPPTSIAHYARRPYGTPRAADSVRAPPAHAPSTDRRRREPAARRQARLRHRCNSRAARLRQDGASCSRPPAQSTIYFTDRSAGRASGASVRASRSRASGSRADRRAERRSRHCRCARASAVRPWRRCPLRAR